MSRRTLPDANETALILAARRTRPARRPPPTAGRALTKLLKPLEDRFGEGPQALQARWREIVGDVLARHTEPVKLSRKKGSAPGSLEIRVNGPAAALIQHQAPEILERVNLFLGTGAVDRLRIIQGPVRALAPPPPRPRRPPPLDAAQEAELARALDDAPDGALKASLLALGRAVLREEARAAAEGVRARRKD
jgi:hypothetical protein